MRLRDVCVCVGGGGLREKISDMYCLDVVCMKT